MSLGGEYFDSGSEGISYSLGSRVYPKSKGPGRREFELPRGSGPGRNSGKEGAFKALRFPWRKAFVHGFGVDQASHSQRWHLVETPSTCVLLLLVLRDVL